MTMKNALINVFWCVFVLTMVEIESSKKNRLIIIFS